MRPYSPIAVSNCGQPWRRRNRSRHRMFSRPHCTGVRWQGTPARPRLSAATPARLGCAVSGNAMTHRPLPGLPALWPCGDGRLDGLDLTGSLGFSWSFC